MPAAAAAIDRGFAAVTGISRLAPAPCSSRTTHPPPRQHPPHGGQKASQRLGSAAASRVLPDSSRATGRGLLARDEQKPTSGPLGARIPLRAEAHAAIKSGNLSGFAGQVNETE